MKNCTAQLRWPGLVSIAMIVSVGLLAGGCVSGGESGAKTGPFTDQPKAKPGRGKFKSNCASIAAPNDVQLASGADAGGVMLGYSAPSTEAASREWPQILIAPSPGPDMLLGWGGGGDGGGHKQPC